MATLTVIAAATAEKGTLGPFTPGGMIDTGAYEFIIVAADGLAGSEEVDIYNVAGTTWVVTADNAGTAQKLTVSRPSVRLEGGIIYGFHKDATVGACGVSATLGPGMVS